MPDGRDGGAGAEFEQAALEELERLQRELEELRTRREAAARAFNAFLKTFGDPDAARPSTPGPTVALHRPVPMMQRAPDQPDASASGETVRPLQAFPPSGISARSTRASREAVEGPRPGREPTADPEVTVQSADVRRRGAQARSPAMAVAAAVAIVLLATAVFLTRGGDRASDEPAASAPAPVAAQEPDVAPAPAPAAPPAEIVALRPVWVRVTIDGERVLERELAADRRVPLVAGETVVVRAGDAGAVRVWIDGQDQGVLGPDGAVVTRTFSSAPSRQLPTTNPRLPPR
jgi:hypothetical protein